MSAIPSISNQSFAYPLENSAVAPGFAAHNITEETIDPEILRLRSTDSLWGEYAPEWDLYLASYEGGKEIMQAKNIYKHRREAEDDYNERVARIHYLNYCEELVDFFTNFIFSETIQRSGGDDNDVWYQQFIHDVNMKGEGIECFMKEVCNYIQIFGMAYILVDSPQLPSVVDRPITKQDEEELKFRPYWILMSPMEILSWQTDDFENIKYIKRRTDLDENGPTGHKILEKYTEWMLDEIKVTIVDATNPRKPQIVSTEVLPNTLKEIPIHVVRYKRSKRYRWMGNSFLRDFAYNNREIMNYTSLLQEFLYRQAFNILVKESDTSIPLRDEEDGVLGSSNMLEVPRGAATPTYISPPVDPAQFIQDERQRIVTEMFKRAAQDMMSELANGEKSSGFSQAQSFSKTVPFISSRADTLESAENALMTLTFKYMKKEWGGKIKYKDRYELTNVVDCITQLVSIFRDLMLPSPTFLKEELRRLVYEMDAKIPADTMKKIMAEIEALDFDKWSEVQQQALVGNAGSSPADQQKPKQTGTMQEVSQESSKDVGSTNKLRDPKNKN